MDSGRRYSDKGGPIVSPDNNFGAGLQGRNALVDIPFRKNTAINGTSVATAYYANGFRRTIYSGELETLIYTPVVTLEGGAQWLLSTKVSLAGDYKSYKTGTAAFGGMPSITRTQDIHFRGVPVPETGQASLLHSAATPVIAVLNFETSGTFSLSLDSTTGPSPYFVDGPTLLSYLRSSGLAFVKPIAYLGTKIYEYAAYGYYYDAGVLKSAIFVYYIPHGYYVDSEYGFSEDKLGIETIGSLTPISTTSYHDTVAAFGHHWEEGVYTGQETVAVSDSLVYYTEFEARFGAPVHWSSFAPIGGGHGYPYFGRIRSVNLDTLAGSDIANLDAIMAAEFTMHKNSAMVLTPCVNMHEHNGTAIVSITGLLAHVDITYREDLSEDWADAYNGIYERFLLILKLEGAGHTVLHAGVVGEYEQVLGATLWITPSAGSAAICANAVSLNDETAYVFFYARTSYSVDTGYTSTVTALRYNATENTIVEVGSSDVQDMTWISALTGNATPPAVRAITPTKVLMVGGHGEAIVGYTATVGLDATDFALSKGGQHTITEVTFEGTETTATITLGAGSLYVIDEDVPWTELHPETVL